MRGGVCRVFVFAVSFVGGSVRTVSCSFYCYFLMSIFMLFFSPPPPQKKKLQVLGWTLNCIRGHFFVGTPPETGVHIGRDLAGSQEPSPWASTVKLQS